MAPAFYVLNMWNFQNWWHTQIESEQQLDSLPGPYLHLQKVSPVQRLPVLALLPQSGSTRTDHCDSLKHLRDSWTLVGKWRPELCSLEPAQVSLQLVCWFCLPPHVTRRHWVCGEESPLREPICSLRGGRGQAHARTHTPTHTRVHTHTQMFFFY